MCIVIIDHFLFQQRSVRILINISLSFGRYNDHSVDEFIRAVVLCLKFL